MDSMDEWWRQVDALIGWITFRALGLVFVIGMGKGGCELVLLV
jgi:hypothetical protein